MLADNLGRGRGIKGVLSAAVPVSAHRAHLYLGTIGASAGCTQALMHVFPAVKQISFLQREDKGYLQIQQKDLLSGEQTDGRDLQIKT